jgi:carbon storage regulator
MLVLSRRLGQAVVVPGLDITVRVIAIKGGAVRIGIEAPPDVKVLREELLAHPYLMVAEPSHSRPQLIPV